MKRCFGWLPWASLSVFLLSFSMMGCGQGGGFSEKAKAGSENVFRYPIPTNPTTLDPGRVSDGDTIDLLQQVYEGLVGWSTDNTVEPRLAEKWEVIEDGKAYKFTLRQGVKFHNGKVMTSEDVKWSIERNVRKGVNENTYGYINDIVGLMDYREGKAPEITGIETPDPQTVIIRIPTPRAYFLGKMTFMVTAIMPKDAVPADSEITTPEQMIGTGPFKVARYVREQLIELVANKDYYGGAPKVDKIQRPVIKDAATRLNKYKAGELDLVAVERQDVVALQNDPQYKDQVKAFDRPSLFYLGLNQNTVKEFQDRRVRRAIGMAIDRAAIVENQLGGLNTVATGIVPPGMPGHRPDAAALPFNVEEAKKLLAEAGFPDGKGFPALEMNFREARPDIRVVAEAVASQLKENLNITVNLRTMEWRAYLEKYDAKQLTFYHMRWMADYLDPENFLSYMLATYGPENKHGYNNPEFDRLCREADAGLDQAKRLALYATAEDIALQDAPWIPVYYQKDFELIHPRVKGLRESLFGHLPHTTVSLSP